MTSFIIIERYNIYSTFLSGLGQGFTGPPWRDIDGWHVYAMIFITKSTSIITLLIAGLGQGFIGLIFLGLG